MEIDVQKYSFPFFCISLHKQVGFERIPPEKPQSWDALHTDPPTLSAQKPVIIITKEGGGQCHGEHSSLKFSQTVLMGSKGEEV